METKQTGIQASPNPDRELTKSFADLRFNRLPVRTSLVQINDDLMQLIADFAAPSFAEGDILVLSEKVVGITQGRVVHSSEVSVTWLAKLIARFVIKYKDDVGWENPKKVQVAIDQAGYPRTILAVVLGGIMKFLFRKPGWYYKIMGPDIAAIDGFNPIAIPPFNEYALLAPANPHQVCEQIQQRFGVPAAIVDASNIATHILGRSSAIPFTDKELVQILEGNPMGQEDEQTPLLIVRKAD